MDRGDGLEGSSLGLPGTSRTKEDDEDSAFESNGRNEDELEDDLDQDLQVIYTLFFLFLKQCSLHR